MRKAPSCSNSLRLRRMLRSTIEVRGINCATATLHD
jgi:hypothetical protein